MKNYTNYKQINNIFFDKLIEQSKDEHSSVGQSSLSHEKRMNKILELGDFNEKKLLDVGCGLGSFYGFLQKHSINLDYTGYDINSKMLEGAKSSYSFIKDRFKKIDIIEENINENFDYAVSIGPLNLFLDEETNYAMTFKMLDNMFKLVKIGCAFSMTSLLSKKQSKDTFYYDPEKIVKHISKYCNNYRLDHSYLPHDFTIFCYKDDFYTKNAINDNSHF